MAEMMKAGTILIKDGALFPDGLTLGSETYAPGWRFIIGLDGFAMDRKIQDVGWSFFYLAGESTTTAVGGAGEATVRRAINKILPGLKSEGANSLQITRVSYKRFFGIPHAIVSFHLRNMQKSMFLLESEKSRTWKEAAFVAA